MEFSNPRDGNNIQWLQWLPRVYLLNPINICLLFPHYNHYLQQQMSIDYNAVSIQDLTKAIYSALSGNNELIQQATNFLRTYLKYISSVPKLTDILMNSQDENVRLYSTVLLRREIRNHFQNMQAEEKEQFKAMLLEKFRSEKSFLVQKNVAGIIGRVLSTINIQEWTGLQVVFQEAIQSAPDSKTTLVLLNQLIGQFKPPQQVVEYMLKCLYHQHLVENALHCLYSFVETENTVDEYVHKGIIEAWNASKWNDDLIFLAVEIFNELALKKNQLKPEVIQWIVERTVKNPSSSDQVKTSGLDFLKELSENQYKNRILNSNDQLLKYVIEALCITICIPPKVNNEQPQEESQAVEDIALYHLETYAENMKTKKFYPIIFDIIVKLIDSEDPNKMNAGFLILASISQACSDRLKRNLANPIMNKLIPKGLEHPAIEVRGAAINTLIFFAQYLVPNIIDYHGLIVPSMVRFMNDSIEKIGEHALTALDMLFDNMEEDQIRKYLPDILPIMCKIWETPTASIVMKKTALTTVASLINASEEKFEPFIDPAYNLALSSLKLPDNSEGIFLKSEGITILGRLALHFTKDEYHNKKQFFTNKIFPLLDPLYTTLVEAKDPNIREGCFTFFYLLATSIKEQFSAIFDKILAEVLKSCQHDASVPVKKPTFSLDEDSEDENAAQMVDIKIPELDEKSAAIHALGAIANACPKLFVPHFQQAYSIIEKHYMHFSENVRIQCINAYENLTEALIKSQNEGKIPEYKQGLPCLQRYPEPLQAHFVTELIPRLVFYMTEQTSADVSACAIQTLETLIKSIGPALIDKSNDSICDAIINLLEGNDKFIDDDDDEDDEEDNEESDDDVNENVYVSLCDLIPAIAKCLRTGFEPNFKAIFPSMMKFMQEDRENVNDNMEMMGCIAQVFRAIPSVIPEFQNEVLTQMAKLRQHADESLNSNICYCLGNMFEGSPQTMNSFLATGISQLKSLYQTSISPATKENALAAIAKIIMNYNTELPLQLLLSTIIDSMPLKADEAEEKTLWKLILHLSNSNGDLLRPHLRKIFDVLQNDMKNPKGYHIEKEPLHSQLMQFGTNLSSLLSQ